MNSFKEFHESGRCPRAGGDNFGSPRLSCLSFPRDQDVPPSFRNIGNFFHPSGNIRGTVYANLNGDIVGRLSGRIEGLPELLGNLGSFGNLGLSLPFSVQFGDRAV